MFQNRALAFRFVLVHASTLKSLFILVLIPLFLCKTLASLFTF